MTCLLPLSPAHPGRDGLDQSLMDLGFNLRTYNTLQHNGFHCLADLARYDEESLLAIRGLGSGAVAEIRKALSRISLDLPFTLAEAQDQPPLTTNISSAKEPVIVVPEPSVEMRWCERVSERIAAGEGVMADRMLQDLQALTQEHFSSLQDRLEEIHQLRGIVRTIAEAGALESLAGTVEPSVVPVVQWKLLRRYGVLIGSGTPATRWLSRLLGLRDLHRAVHAFLLHSSGITIQAIGAAMAPPLSREAVRQQIKPVEMTVGCCTRDLERQIQQLDQQRGAVLLRNWIRTHGRLPFHTDQPCEDQQLDHSGGDLLKKVSESSLNLRLALYADLSLPVPAAEWDLHCRVIGNGEKHVGTGYWKELEPLRQFLPRYAAVIRTPGQMPLQTQLPPSVRGAVERHGGQSAVARAVGLRYQGQLVGANGRTYWTKDLLTQLLEDAAARWALPAGAMPSKDQIRDFMQTAVYSSYWGKKPVSALAAITSWGKLSWPEAAQRFGRRVA